MHSCRPCFSCVFIILCPAMCSIGHSSHGSCVTHGTLAPCVYQPSFVLLCAALCTLVID
ncbi:hypothetical protein B0O80DRAFT_472884 [Mortierella sp. GBAus27b]|nr:hypothetical protein B0O80DRAFT_472884 [Mortierella sp. GBAus27b]